MFIVAHYPDGRTQTVFSVPHYRFMNAREVTLREPLRIPKDTRLEVIAHYDNSSENPDNPNPHRDVAWGTTTYDNEMFKGNFFYLKEDDDRSNRPAVNE